MENKNKQIDRRTFLRIGLAAGGAAILGVEAACGATPTPTPVPTAGPDRVATAVSENTAALNRLADNLKSQPAPVAKPVAESKPISAPVDEKPVQPTVVSKPVAEAKPAAPVQQDTPRRAPDAPVGSQSTAESAGSTQAPAVIRPNFDHSKLILANAEKYNPAPLNDTQLDAMPKATIEKANWNEWFHRVHNEDLFIAPRWDGADNWAWSLKKLATRNGKFEGYVNTPAQFVHRMDPGKREAEFAFGVWANEMYRGNNVWNEAQVGTFGGVRRRYSNAPMGINIRAATAEVYLVDPDSREVLKSVDGHDMGGSVSDGHDMMVVLGKRSRIGIWVTNIRVNSEGYESRIWRGPADDPSTEDTRNHLHADPKTHPITQ